MGNFKKYWIFWKIFMMTTRKRSSFFLDWNFAKILKIQKILVRIKLDQGHLGISDPSKLDFYQSTTNKIHQTHGPTRPTGPSLDRPKKENHEKPKKPLKYIFKKTWLPKKTQFYFVNLFWCNASIGILKSHIEIS